MTLWMMTRGGRQPVRGTVVGPLFVHRVITSPPTAADYSISHAATGTFIVVWIKDRKRAIAIAKELGALGGWEQALEQLRKNITQLNRVKKVLCRYGIRSRQLGDRLDGREHKEWPR